MKKSHSVQFWFLFFLMIYACCSSILAILVSVHTLHNLRKESAQNRQEMLNFYMEQTDTSLRNAYYSLLEISSLNEDLIALQLNSTDISENALHRSALRQDLLSLSSSKTDVTGYFLYVESDTFSNEFFTYTVNGSQAQVNSITRSAFLKFVKEAYTADDFKIGKWFIASLNEQAYLFCFTYTNNAYIGCYINMESLIKPLDEIEAQRGYSLLADGSGKILTNSLLPLEYVDLIQDNSTYHMEAIEGNEYIVINAKSAMTDMYLVAFISSWTVFASFAPFFITLLIILFAIIILLPLLFLVFWSILNSSFSGLLSTIEKVKQGNTDARADTNTRISEMVTLTRSFNEMLGEINQLKISIYEQQLKERQTYLDYLQIQIHPHFFLNCLNLVYSLAELKRYQEIKSLSLSLVKFMRFLFHRSTSLVTVTEELDHVRNYIAIHQFRFSNTIQCHILVEPDLESARIPPLSIQTFVENSVKHGQNAKKETEISISVERQKTNLKITVRDNGKGFPFDVLVGLNSGQRLNTDEIHRIGITNVRERLAILFGEEASMRFYNNQGSVSEILIPLLFDSPDTGERDGK